MNPKSVLTASAVYLALVGLGLLFAPEAMMFVSMAGVPAGVLFALRSYGGTLIGLAVLDWGARNSDATPARDAIFLGSTVGYGVSAVVLLIGAAGGSSPSQVWAFAVINVLFTGAFFAVGRKNMSKSGS